MSDNGNHISRVTRSKDAAKISYDRMSRWYDLIAGTSEQQYVKTGLDLLRAAEGERILEIGYGTGKSTLNLAQSVGESGRVYGLDLSEGMQHVASRRINKAGLLDRVELRCGDAVSLPFPDNSFDAVFMSFTLELFDIPEIPIVLRECKRVLRNYRRIVVVSMAKPHKASMAVRLYEWVHKMFPNYADCRPIYPAAALSAAGFHVSVKKDMSMWGLPVAAVLATKGES